MGRSGSTGNDGFLHRDDSLALRRLTGAPSQSRSAGPPRGFDPDNIPPEHLGVGIMRERAEAVGATLDIESQTGRGTQVTMVWQDS